MGSIFKDVLKQSLLGFIFCFIQCFSLSAQQVKYPSSADEYRKKCKDTHSLTEPDQVKVVVRNDSSSLIKISPASFVNSYINKAKDGIALVYLDSDSCTGSVKSVFYNRNELLAAQYNNSRDTISYLCSVSPVDYQLYFVKNGYLCQPRPKEYVRERIPEAITFDLKPYMLSADSMAKVRESGLKTDITIYYKADKNGLEEDVVNRITARLNDIESIAGITINGYLSVESLFPQKQQIMDNVNAIAESINNKYPDLQVHVNVEQNWSDFYKDVQLTRFSNWSSKSKYFVKRKLMSKNNKRQLESVLSRHRKIVLHINSKLDMEEWDEKQLLYHYKNAYRNNDLSLLLYIQNHMFTAIDDGNMSYDLYKQTNLPLKANLGPAFLNQLINQYKDGFIKTEDAIVRLSEMKIYYPDLYLIEYNLLKFHLDALKNAPASISEQSILDLLSKLEKSQKNGKEFYRSRMYYHMIKAQQAFRVDNIDGLDYHLDNTIKYYSSDFYTPEDAVTLSGFLIFFNRYMESENILYSYCKNNEPSENVLYEYLNLSYPPALSTHSEADIFEIIKNSYNLNNSRFCSEFITTGKFIPYQMILKDKLHDFRCNICR